MLNNLPKEVLNEILLDFLDVKDIVCMCCVWRDFSLGYVYENILLWCKNVRLKKSIVPDGDLGLFRKGGECFSIMKSANICCKSFDKLRFDRIRVLDLPKCNKVTDHLIQQFVNIEVLKLPRCTKISDKGVCDLVKIKVLDLSIALGITDKGIRNMVEMEELRLFFNRNVTMNGVCEMKGLKILLVAYNNSFSDSVVRNAFPSIEKFYIMC